jgi:uncharacterized small protein (TIGR04563 family)
MPLVPEKPGPLATEPASPSPRDARRDAFAEARADLDRPPGPPILRAVGEEPAGASDRRKQSVYFPEGMLQEIEREAERLDRTLSWVVQTAWRIARCRMAAPPDREVPGLERAADGKVVA